MVCEFPGAVKERIGGTQQLTRSHTVSEQNVPGAEMCSAEFRRSSKNVKGSMARVCIIWWASLWRLLDYHHC